MLKIRTKINLLIGLIVTASILFTLLMQTLKTQELEYYTLVEQVKTVNGHILKALVEEKKIGFAGSPGGTIFDHLDNAAGTLGEIDSSLLGLDASSISEISRVIEQFRSAMGKRAENTASLLQTKSRILEATRSYTDVHDAISRKIDREIADSQLYNWKGFDTRGLLELKRSGAFAHNLIGGIILSMSQELFLEQDMDAFVKRYEKALFALGIQEENLGLQVKLLKGTQYDRASAELTKTLSLLQILMPEMLDLVQRGGEISAGLEVYERIIGDHTESLIALSESLSREKNRTASLSLFAGLTAFFAFLTIGGVAFGRSITVPLSTLVQATNSMGEKSLEPLPEPVSASLGRIAGPERDDEIGVLTRSFIGMENEIREKIAMLRQSENNLSTTLDSMGDGVIATDLSGRIARMNPVAETLLARDESEARGRPLTEVFHIVHAESGELKENPIETVLARGRAAGLANHTKLIDGNGKELHIAYGATPIKNGNDKVTGVVLIFRDVTREYRMREARRESEARYMRLFAESNDAIFITAPNGEVIESNPAASRMFGYSPDEMARMNIVRLYANPAQREKFRKEIEAGGEVKDFEVAFVNKKGAPLTCLMSATLKHDKAGNLLGYQGFVRNVTRQKQLERQLQQAQKMEAIGTLAGGIAHDFNNILTGIYGYAQLAGQHIHKPEKARQYMDRVIGGGKRAADLVQQILTFSRQTEYRMHPFELRVEIKEALKLIRSSVPSTIEMDLSLDSTSKALADPIKIHQVVMNLCTNAYHAMNDSGGRMSVALSDVTTAAPQSVGTKEMPPGEYIRLSVGDTGTGMDKATLEKAFEPYFTTNEPSRGTGLGLALVQAIVEEHGAFLQVFSTPGEGTTFHIHFPRAEQEAEPASAEPRRTEGLSGNETIMIVDDEMDIRELYRIFLESYGYRVFTFENGLDALAALEKDPGRFDLVVTDMTMPGLTGEELARKIYGISPELPVILCTGFSNAPKAPVEGETGIQRRVQKPISNLDLVTMIREIRDNRPLGKSTEPQLEEDDVARSL